jgi:type VI protein secretion system component VasK
LLEPDKPSPLREVEDWLTKSNVLDDKLRQPFLLPVRAAYEQALRAVEQAAATAYAAEMLPRVTPIFAQFPFDPSSRVDAVPAEVQSVLGPKGSFLTTFNDVFGPVTVRDARGNWQPRKVAGYRSLSLSREALDLGRWAAGLSTFLWSETGAPRAVPLSVRPVPLARIESGAADAPTLAVLRSGSTTVAAFNQATTWKTLPVEWWTASPAALGLEFTTVDGASRRALSAEAPGAAWRFFHLLRRGSLTQGVVRWSLDNAPEHDVAFELRADPWQALVPPHNQSRFCVLESPWDGT